MNQKTNELKDMPQDRGPRAIAYTKDDLIDLMNSKGYEVLGEGLHAIVFGKDNKVAKFFQGRDECFVDFVRFSRERSENPHLPKFGEIHESVVVLNGKDEYHLVFTEKLQAPPKRLINRESFLGQAYIYLRKFHLQTGKFSPNKKDQVKFDSALRRLEKSQPGLVQTIVDIHKDPSLTNCIWDLHEENFMMREDGTLVIIDPVSGQLGKHIAGHIGSMEEPNL